MSGPDRQSVGPWRIFRRAPWENGATALIGLGVVMLMQPYSLWLFSYSFAVLVVIHVGFVMTLGYF